MYTHHGQYPFQNNKLNFVIQQFLTCDPCTPGVGKSFKLWRKIIARSNCTHWMKNSLLKLFSGLQIFQLGDTRILKGSETQIYQSNLNVMKKLSINDLYFILRNVYRKIQKVKLFINLTFCFTFFTFELFNGKWQKSIYSSDRKYFGFLSFKSR